MKIVWVSQTPIGEALEGLGYKNDYNGAGWMTSLMPFLSDRNEIELTVISISNTVKSLKEIKVGKINHYVVSQIDAYNTSSIQKCIIDFAYILKSVKPDVIHVFGTEGPYAYAMLNAAKEEYKVAIQITGLVSICAKHFFYGIDQKWINRRSLGDIIRNGGINRLKKDFEYRGEYEIAALKKAKYVIGKTNWDRINATLINEKLKYYKNNEILRPVFYKDSWSYENCEIHSIFASTGNYSIKGLHYLLLSLPAVLEKYPDAKLYIGGPDIIKSDEIIDRIKMTSYGKYIKYLIKYLKIGNNVFFTGNLTESQMKERMIISNVFVSPSLMENESNSLSEAKYLGVPCVASFVGGVVDRIEHGVDGFTYNFAEYNMITYYILEIFNNIELSKKISINARNNAMKINDRKKNVEDLIEIYREIIINE